LIAALMSAAGMLFVQSPVKPDANTGKVVLTQLFGPNYPLQTIYFA
jgi:hypothetical protein